MLKLNTALLSAAFLIAASPAARAQVTIDVAKITCDQFVLYKVASPDTLAIWLHGYYSGKRGQTVVDVQALKANAKKLRDHCLKNGDQPLMEAVEQVLAPGD
jgi:acid stress chaperone HdeB